MNDPVNATTTDDVANEQATVTITISLPYEKIAEMLRTAFDRASRYWGMFLYTNAAPWDATVVDNVDEGKTNYALSFDKVLTGLQLCAQQYPAHFRDFVQGFYYGSTADVILQLSVFGEVKYG